VAVRRGEVNAGAVIPANYDVALRTGDPAPVAFVALGTNPSGPAFRTVVDAIVTRDAGAAIAARLASAGSGVTFDQALGEARAGQRSRPDATLVRIAGGTGTPFRGGFDYTAPTNLVLFMFISAMAAAAVIPMSRSLGIVSRVLATPTSRTTVLLGLGAGRYLVAVVQALFIIVVGSLVFGVYWGDPVALAVIVLLFGLVSTGAALLLGARAKSFEQTIALGIPLGIALGMLGGCMWPLAIVGNTMRAVGHLTPHAWAVDALMALSVKRATLGAILPQLGVLAAFALALVALGAWQLRAVLPGGAERPFARRRASELRTVVAEQ
jgi:ABC-2 type transport system permease protein